MPDRNLSELSSRDAIEGGMPSEREVLVSRASDILISNLMSLSRQLPFEWVVTSISGREVLDINSVLPLALAWSKLDVSRAESIIKCIFYLQDSDGAIASRYLSDGTPLTSDAPWPLIIQATRKVWESGQNTDFLRAVMPRIYRYVDWICYHFDPEQTGLPRWQSKEESLVPEIYGEGIATPDLTILLLGELEAIVLLENEHPEIFTDKLYIKPEIDKLANLLEQNFWSRADSRCISRRLSGETIEAPLFFTALLSSCKSISPELRIHSKPVLISALGDIHNQDLWPAHESNQINTIFAVLLIESAMNAGISADCMQFCEELISNTDNFYRSTGIIPDGIKKNSGNKFDAYEGCRAVIPITMAALIIHIDGFIKRQGSQSTRNIVLLQKLNRHPIICVSIPLAILTLLVLSITIFSILRTKPTGAYIEAGMGLANQYYEIGRYKDALIISEDLINKHWDTYHPRLMRAKILYKMKRYGDAEAELQDIVDDDTAYPTVRLDLALMKYKLSQFHEAIDIYNNFINDYGGAFPYEAEKAKQAINLIEKYSINVNAVQAGDD